MTASTPEHIESAEELFQAGKPDEALAVLFEALWSNQAGPEDHLLLWDILDAQRLEQQRLERLRNVVHNSTAVIPRGAGSPLLKPASPAFSRPREAPRYSTVKPVILVGHDARNRFFAELATVEVLSAKGAMVCSHQELSVGEQVHLFSTVAGETNSVVALVRNSRLEPENGRRQHGVEFLRKPGTWLLSDEQLEQDENASDTASESSSSEPEKGENQAE